MCASCAAVGCEVSPQRLCPQACQLPCFTPAVPHPRSECECASLACLGGAFLTVVTPRHHLVLGRCGPRHSEADEAVQGQAPRDYVLGHVTLVS